MGNWRRVQIVGTCDRADVPKLREALEPGVDYQNFHCLCCGGIAGLPNWASETINAVGNLGERDYTPQSVADQLLKLLAVAPSLNVKVHCGNDYEADDCIKTVIAKTAPVVAVVDPEITIIPETPTGQMQRNMMQQLMRQR